MDLVSALGPPRLCRLAGEDFWITPASLQDVAMLLAWLDDVVPGKADRKVPPRLGDPESRDLMETASGRLVTLWAGMRHHGRTYQETIGLLANCTPEEWASYVAAFFCRRRTMKDDGTPGRDVADQWFGPNFAALCERYSHTLEAVGRLTLDQYALLCGDGLEHEDPRRLSAAEVEEMRQRGLKLMAEREAANGKAASPTS